METMGSCCRFIKRNLFKFCNLNEFELISCTFKQFLQLCVFCIFCKVYETLFENHIIYINNYSTRACSVADADLQMRGGAGGRGVIQTLRKGVGPVSKKNFSGPFGPRVWSTNKRGPSPGSASGAGYQMVDSQRWL